MSTVTAQEEGTRWNTLPSRKKGSDYIERAHNTGIHNTSAIVDPINSTFEKREVTMRSILVLAMLSVMIAVTLALQDAAGTLSG